jgi:hypothetical protein
MFEARDSKLEEIVWKFDCSNFGFVSNGSLTDASPEIRISDF